ncbi:hypothetical protein A4E84_35620 [Streptomyces qaidamensis]|uniref:Uncharacterized protein n=1 Tax=Streptomyces qaidamensis TaxID=1783515 RepID=A0A143CA95_9ACTN|nr:hypothetical protein A4E84_35620 [Streptomyces qaidamensis]
MPDSFYAPATTTFLTVPLSVWLAAIAFAAAVIGGIALDGGRGTMSGALTGVLLPGVAQNLLTLAQVPSFWIQAIHGGIILVALMIARVTTGRAQD